MLQPQLQQQLPLQQQQPQAQPIVNQTSQQFPPPPMYQQRPNRLTMHQNSNRMVNRPAAPQYSVPTSTAQYTIQVWYQFFFFFIRKLVLYLFLRILINEVIFYDAIPLMCIRAITFLRFLFYLFKKL